MNMWLGVTDWDWYRYLAGIQAEEVNFWQPGGTTNFRVLKEGELFLFKLKHPYNAIGGGGFFVKQTFLPLSVAWGIFQEKNGTDSFAKFRDKIMGYRQKKETNPQIGCIALTNTFFFDKSSGFHSLSIGQIVLYREKPILLIHLQDAPFMSKSWQD